jgi:hypothetical protein
VSGYFGKLAHGVDADDSFQCQVGLQREPSGEIIRGDCSGQLGA